MDQQRVRIKRTLTYRDISNLVNAAEQAGGCAYILKSGRMIPVNNLIGMLTLRLTANDMVTLVDNGGAAAETAYEILTGKGG